MRKLTLLFASLLIVSCSTDEEPALDCNCDRIVESTTFNAVGVGSFGTYTTINDCTGIQKSWRWTRTSPTIGDCKE